MTPNGKYTAFAVNALGVFKNKTTVTEPFELFYHSGEIYGYDIEKDMLTPLKGASDINFVQDMPFFSPDGKSLIFSRYQCNIRGRNPSIRSMDLYKVPFNDGKGGDPIPIENAFSNNKHQYFPRYAPNGKWISFC